MKLKSSHRSNDAASEAANKLSTAVKTGDMQAAKLSQIMLESGNDELNEAVKQLVNIRACKEKLQLRQVDESTEYG